MNDASGRVLLDDRPVGTAWRFHERYALTAAHCVTEGKNARPLPKEVKVHFFGLPPLRARAQVNEAIDAALLEFLDPVPDAVSMLELSRPPPQEQLTKYEWRGIAYPLVSGFRETIICGDILGYVRVDGGVALQISFKDFVNHRVGSEETMLSYASGAAVTYQECAIGIVRASLAETQLGYAVPIDRIANVFTQVAERLRGYPPPGGGTRWREIDRRNQWVEVVAAIGMPESKTFLLPGGSGEGHKTFVERVQSYMAGPPPRGTFVDVSWPAVWTPSDCAEALADAVAHELGFDVLDEPRLIAQLQRKASESKVVIAHEVIDPANHDDEDLDAMVEYFQYVLPELLATVRGHGVLCLQPIEWADASGKRRALDLMARLARTDSPNIEALHELTPLSVADLESFGVAPTDIEKWRQKQTTSAAYRLVKESTSPGRRYGSRTIPPVHR